MSKRKGRLYTPPPVCEELKGFKRKNPPRLDPHAALERWRLKFNWGQESPPASVPEPAPLPEVPPAPSEPPPRVQVMILHGEPRVLVNGILLPDESPVDDWVQRVFKQYSEY